MSRGEQWFEIAGSNGDLDLMSQPKVRQHGVQHARELGRAGELQSELHGELLQTKQSVNRQRAKMLYHAQQIGGAVNRLPAGNTLEPACE